MKKARSYTLLAYLVLCIGQPAVAQQSLGHSSKDRVAFQHHNPALRARSVVAADFGIGVAGIFPFLPLRLGASAEFPINKHFVAGVNLQGGILAFDSFDSMVGILHAGPILRARIPLNDKVAWQMPFYVAVGMFVLEDPTVLGLIGASFMSVEFFISSRVGLQLDALLGVDWLFTQGPFWSWRFFAVGLVLPWG
ncbi:MAG: hypothetical protein AAF320_00210 [Myxococcota bacterium]